MILYVFNAGRVSVFIVAGSTMYLIITFVICVAFAVILSLSHLLNLFLHSF